MCWYRLKPKQFVAPLHGIMLLCCVSFLKTLTARGFMSSAANNWKKATELLQPAMIYDIHTSTSQPDSQTRGGSFYVFTVKVLLAPLCSSQVISQPAAAASVLLLFFFFPPLHFQSPTHWFLCMFVFISSPPDLLWYDTSVQYFSVCSFFQTVVSGKRYVLL